MEIIKSDTHFNFVRLMKPAVALSIAVIIIGIASLIWHGGPNYGIDFAGGTLIQIKFQNETHADKIRAAFKTIGFEGSIIQEYGPKEVIVRTAESGIDAKGLTARVDGMLSSSFGAGAYEIRRIEMVGPKVGKDLTKKAISMRPRGFKNLICQTHFGSQVCSPHCRSFSLFSNEGEGKGEQGK